MKLAIIPPNGSLDLAHIGDVYFALAHFSNPEYNAFYRKAADAGKHVILDNGAFELGKSVDWEVLMNVADAMHATEVIAPDVQWQPDETLQEASDFALWFREHHYDRRFKLMSVVWSHGPDDYLEYFARHKEMVAPDRYGIGKWLEGKYALGTRMHTIYKIQKKFNLGPERFHALGCPRPIEVSLMRDVVWSMDTGMASKAALQGHAVDPWSIYDIPNVELTALTDEQYALSERNARLLVDAARGLLD